MNDLVLRALWRLAALLLAVAFIVVGGALLAHALDAVRPFGLLFGGGGLRLRLDLTDLPLRVRWVWAAIGLLLVLLGLFFAWLAAARTATARERAQRVRLSGAAGTGQYRSGEVTVGMESLHALVAHRAERDPAVREAAPALRLGRKGWQLGCRLSVVPDAEIPAVVARLKPALADALERHTGLPVVRTDLDVQVFALDGRARVH